MSARLAAIHLPLAPPADRAHRRSAPSRFAPRANITAHRQRHHRVVLERGSGLPGLRAVPRRVRRHPHADRRARRPTPPSGCSRSETLDVHRARHRRHRARRHRRARRQPRDGDDRRGAAAQRPGRPEPDGDGGLDVRPLLEDRRHADRRDDVRRRALEDDLIRGDLVSDRRDGRPRSSSASTRTASTRSAPASSSGSTRSSIRGCRRASRRTTTAAWRSARPTTAITLDNQRSSRRRFCVITLIAHLPDVPLVAQDAR